jgi:hypothetical protein
MTDMPKNKLNFDPTGSLLKSMRLNANLTIRIAVAASLNTGRVYDSIMDIAKLYDDNEAEYPENNESKKQAHWTGSAVAIHAVLSLEPRQTEVPPIDIISQYIAHPGTAILEASSSPAHTILAAKSGIDVIAEELSPIAEHVYMQYMQSDDTIDYAEYAEAGLAFTALRLLESYSVLTHAKNVLQGVDWDNELKVLNDEK